jgi:hypothetical protein
MSVEVMGNIIRIVGNAPVSDAEPVLAALLDDPLRTIDLTNAAHLHSAVIQILLAVRPRITGTPSYPFFTSYVLPQLDRG